MFSPKMFAAPQAEKAASAPQASGGGRAYSLRRSLYALVLLCVLPMVVLSGYLVWSNHRMERQRLYGDSILWARKVAADLDRELSAMESGLKILATSEHLQSGDLRRFHQQAREAVPTQIVYNYVLTDRQGRQLLNTVRPYGEVLPAGGTPPQLQQVFDRQQTVLTDLFVGPVVKRPVVAMGVPVWVGAEVRYSLNIGLDPEALNALLQQEPLPPDWLLVVLDGAGTIVARSRAADRFVGTPAVPQVLQAIRARPEGSIETVTKEGIASVSSHHRLDRWSWTVAVGVHRAVLERELFKDWLGLLLASALALGAGVWLAWRLIQRVVQSIEGLNAAAQSIGARQPAVWPATRFREAEAVWDTLKRAAQAMSQVQEYAYHDPLTGLANRRLFDELAHAHWATVQRQGGGLAVLAIDLDNFKAVNDTHGHAAGDALLRDVAQRLRARVRESDVVARIGGDEFLLLVCPSDGAAAQELAARLIEALSAPYEGVTPRVSASVGIAVYPHDGSHMDALVQAADAALYGAKRSGKACHQRWGAAGEASAVAGSV